MKRLHPEFLIPVRVHEEFPHGNGSPLPAPRPQRSVADFASGVGVTQQRMLDAFDVFVGLGIRHSKNSDLRTSETQFLQLHLLIGFVLSGQRQAVQNYETHHDQQPMIHEHYLFSGLSRSKVIRQ